MQSAGAAGAYPSPDENTLQRQRPFSRTHLAKRKTAAVDNCGSDSGGAVFIRSPVDENNFEPADQIAISQPFVYREETRNRFHECQRRKSDSADGA